MIKDRPLIGINADYYTPAKGRSPHSIVHSGYYECLLTAGALPIILPPLTKEVDLAPILDRLDGLILTEGDDLEPKKMGLTPHPAVKAISDRRETHDRLLCRLVQERKMPVLGVGLGMQELNVVYGGGIYLHLPEDFPKGFPHRDPQGGAHRHIVIMERGSILEDIYGDGEICVNSYHHQGIRKIAPGFRAGALAPDGLVEAIEWKGEDWFCIGVQWHPQNEGNISLDMQLIEAFVNAAAKATPIRGEKTIKLAKAG
ncbi:MAG: putative glutamine amidotransferase [Planctomycetota bacterium]|nr:putative glutamine amidotransferase [Planctomycetota bacterium]